LIPFDITTSWAFAVVDDASVAPGGVLSALGGGVVEPAMPADTAAPEELDVLEESPPLQPASASNATRGQAVNDFDMETPF
jgi:hypothetical protein